MKSDNLTSLDHKALQSIRQTHREQITIAWLSQQLRIDFMKALNTIEHLQQQGILKKYNHDRINIYWRLI